MAQEKISFNSALMSLPLQVDTSHLSRCSCPDDRQTWDIDARVLLELPQRWQPGLFFIRKADSSSAKFVINIYNALTGSQTPVKTLASAQLAGIKVYRRAATVSNGQAWDTVVVPPVTNLTVDLNPGVYYLTVAGLTSELFRVVTYLDNDHLPDHDHIQVSLSNNAKLAEIPYPTGYKQIFGLPGVLCASEPKTYTEGEKSERYGDKTTYSRQYRVWSLDLLEVSPSMAELLKSFELHESVTLKDLRKVVTAPGSRVKVSAKEDTCCTLSVSISIEETISEWGVCQADLALVEQSLTPADIGYVDPADADPSADPYAPDAGGTIPDGPAGVPAAGTIISETETTTDCSNPFVDTASGLRYKHKTTIARSDGAGGQVVEYLYSDPCAIDPVLVPVPRIRGIINDLFMRVGQPFNGFLFDPALLLPATGQIQAPTIAVTGLPNGVTYSGGRLSGTPTTAGESPISVVISQPGGGSVSLPATITTIAAAPTTANVGLAVTTDYNSDNQSLSVYISSSFRPQVQISQTGQTPSGFILASTGESADSWVVTFPSIVNDGTLQVRQAGDSGSGISFPYSVTPSPPAPSLPFTFTNPIDGQPLVLHYNTTTNKYELINGTADALGKTLLELAREASDPDILATVDELTIKLSQLTQFTTDQPLILNGGGDRDYERHLSSGVTGGFRLFVDEQLKALLGYIGAGYTGILNTSTGSSIGLSDTTARIQAQTLQAAGADTHLRTLALATLPAAISPISTILVAELDADGEYHVRAANPASLNLPGSTPVGADRQTRLAGCIVLSKADYVTPYITALTN